MSEKEMDSNEKELEVFDSNGNIDWDSVGEIYKGSKGAKEIEEPENKQVFECKKCKKSFHCANYTGKYPLCYEHRKKE